MYPSENSEVPNARFQAAGAIGDAAIREWGMLTNENRKSLILYAPYFADLTEPFILLIIR